jgi:hypothetical protein
MNTRQFHDVLVLTKGWGWSVVNYRPHLAQFLMAPYFGPGLLPHAQKMPIDELAVGTTRIEPPTRRAAR